jgi:predicted DNA-binding transcriptional regulator AlpA
VSNPVPEPANITELRPADEPAPVTIDELLRLPVVIDLPTAARILGIGRTVAYEMAREGTFPTPVLRIGSKNIRVPTAPLLDLLGVAWREDAA